jgi:serine protease AprX
MDKIGPKLDATQARSAAPAESKEKAAAEPLDSIDLKFGKQDLTKDGKLGLIIEAKDPVKREELKAKLLSQNPGNTLKADLPIIDGFAVEVDPNSVGILPELGRAVKDMKVFLDGRVGIPEPIFTESPEVTPMMDVATKTLRVDKVWEKGITGKGVTIAVVDTGIDPHPDLRNKIVGFADMVGGKTQPYDDQGHGTHVSGIAAGTGEASEGKFKGVAPEASLVGVKVLDANGSGSFSDVIKGIQWVVENKDKYKINVMNMSLGGRASQSYKDDPVAQAVEKVFEAGIIPVIAAGNSGPSAKTVGTPAHALNCITVAALDDKGTIERSDDGIASFSSRGPTPYDNLVKPDVAAPGVKITAPKAGTNEYTTMSGTSMATPYTAGVVALMVNAKPDIKPQEAKDLIFSTGEKIPKVDDTVQGTAGVINPLDAVSKLLEQNPPAPPPAKA